MGRGTWLLACVSLMCGVVASRGADPVAGFGTALEFDGADDHVLIADHDELDLTVDYTLECWFKADSFGSLRGLIGKYHRAGANGYLLRLWDTELDFDGRKTSGLGLEADRWYHVAGVNDGGTRKLYVDGSEVPVSSSSFTVRANTDPIRLGSDYGGRYLDGKMDEVRIWSAALSANVITNWTHREVDPTHPSYSNLVAYYKLNDGSGTTATDVTGTHSGTLENMAGTGWSASDISGAYSLYEGEAVGGQLIGNDADGASSDGTDWAISFEIVEAAVLGTATVTVDNVFRYTAQSGVAGEDAFAYRVRDGLDNLSNVQTVSVTVVARAGVLVVTNPVDSATVASETAAIAVQGTNNPYIVGTMWWTNAANDANGTLAAASPWTIPGVPLDFGENVITVSGTNHAGEVVSDGVTVTREPLHGGDSPVHYVWTNSPAPAWPYTNWATAARVIQDAVDAAASNDTVLVTNGVYDAGVKDQGTHGRSRVAVSRAVDIRSVNGPEVTLIVGAPHTNGGNGATAIRCLRVELGARVSGFTLTNGFTQTTYHGSWDHDNRHGGGAMIRPQCVVSNCIITECWSSAGAAGAFLYYGGTLTHTTVRDCHGYNGGGIYTFHGGTVRNCLVYGNDCPNGYGGGIYGHYSGTFENCTITRNHAGVDGGGFVCENSLSDVFLRNCIIAGNTADGGTPEWISLRSRHVAFCCMPGSIPGGSGDKGCIADDPRFLSPETDDFRLAADSPCTDAGTNQVWMAESTDLRGAPRLWDGVVDMGAYEDAMRPEVYISNADQDVFGETATFTVGGSNNAHVVGTMWWTNTATGAGGFLSASPSWSIPSIELAWGENEIYVYGTNVWDTVSGDSVTLTRISEHGGDSPIHYVSTNGAPVWPYTNWASAATTIQAAVDAASAGDTVLVTNGTYVSGGAEVYGTSNRVALSRAVALHSVNGATYTHIVGETAMRCVYLTNGAVLAGFTLTGGHTGTNGDWTARSGGGLLIDRGGSVSNCIVSGNSADADGAGAYCRDGGRLDFCTVTGNSAGGNGGGIACHDGGTVRNSVAWGNTAGASGPNWHCVGSDISFTYTCTAPVDGLPDGAGCFEEDPLFVDAGFGDYHLRSESGTWNADLGNWVLYSISSPCIDRADPARDSDMEPPPNGARANVGAYGKTGEASKSGRPVVFTTNVTELAASSATCGGVITEQGESPVLLRGCVWNTSGSPTIDDDRTTDGSGTGTFASELTGLTPSTTYYIRAYARNSQGVRYGLTRVVTTLPPPTAGFGTALEFDGADDHVLIADHDELDLTVDYTLECWFKADSFGSLRGLIGKYHRAGANGYLLRLWDTELDFDGRKTSGLGLEADRWYHVAGVNDGGTRKLYVDGSEVPVSSSSFTVRANTDPIRLGSDYGGRYLDGKMDEVRIWSTALSANVITNWTYREVDPTHPSYSNLVAYYKLNDGSGATAADATGTHHGTLANMAGTAWLASDAGVHWTMVEGYPGTGYLVGSDEVGSSSNGLDWALSFEIVDQPVHGTATVVNANVVRYSVDAKVASQDFFTYRVRNEEGFVSGLATARVTIVVAPPYVDITTEDGTPGQEITTYTIEGTNSVEVEGTMWWTNALNGANGTLAAASPWTISGIPLDMGRNVISVFGSNYAGDVASDNVTLTRGIWHAGDSPTHYVSTSGTAAYPYTNWATAARVIQDAVDAAAPGDTVFVEDGVYDTGGAPGGSRVRIPQAVTLKSLRGPEHTSIVGDTNNIRCVYLDASGAVLSGFTLTNGVVTGSRYGGGAYLDPGSTVTNCVITGCSANYGGGGAYGNYGGRIVDCEILGNRTGPYRSGGGIHLYRGGTVERCTFRNNWAGAKGGGVHIRQLGSVYGCLIEGNTADADGPYAGGGGVSLDYGGLAENCRIVSNIASNRSFSYGYGGGVNIEDRGTVRGCLITGNLADNNGGGVYLHNGGHVDSCTVAGNSATHRGGGVTYNRYDDDRPRSVINTIIYDNTAGLHPDWYGIDYGSFLVDHCCTTPTNDLTDSSNITNAPAFSNPARGDFRLSSRSPCINAGTNETWMADRTDLDGNPRIFEGTVDMGAYELFGVHSGVSPFHYVSPGGGNVWPYTNWADAATVIQDAVDSTASDDTVLVAAGTYTSGGAETPGYGLMNRVMIDKPIALRSADGPETTFIVGEADPHAPSGNGPAAMRCVHLVDGAVLDGFTLTNGHTLVTGEFNLNRGGGGVLLRHGGTVSNCVIVGCSANVFGGGADLHHGGELYGCIIRGNHSEIDGGGAVVNYGRMVNTLLVGNSAADDGGGCQTYSAGLLENCTLSDNRAGDEGGGVNVVYGGTHRNCIIYGNPATANPVTPGDVRENCFTEDPFFLGSGNYRLEAGSPCIDAGTNQAWMAGAGDLDGRTRIIGAAVDIGCYESVAEFTGASPMHYVSPDGGNDWPYTNWAGAATFIQDAVTAAGDSDTVLVTNGTYFPITRLTVARPIAVRSVNGPDVTVVDGRDLNGLEDERSCFHLGGSACVLEGFTITGGGSYSEYMYGGGVYCDNTAPLVTNCILRANRAEYGGGSYRGTLTHCTLDSNSALAPDSQGGGSYESVLSHCTVVSNSAHVSAGGSYKGTLTHCIIKGNNAGEDGGGSYWSTLDNCLVVGNAGGIGGGSYRGTLTHCTLAGNEAGESAGGCYGARLTNCIVSGNSATLSPPHNIESGSAVHTCSPDLSNGVSGNITNAPLFIGGGDYHLQSGSPCIDSGTTLGTAGDLEGTPRPLDGDANGSAVADMGAYEFASSAVDSDGDGASDYAERVADTGILDSDDWFRIAAISNRPAPPGGGGQAGSSPAAVYFESSANRRYTVAGRSNLLIGAWSDVPGAGPRLGTGGTDMLQDTNVPPRGPFYRLQVDLPADPRRF